MMRTSSVLFQFYTTTTISEKKNVILSDVSHGFACTTQGRWARRGPWGEFAGPLRVYARRGAMPAGFR